MQRTFVVMWIAVLAGCPDPLVGSRAPSASDILDGEGTLWSWGVPACAAMRTSVGSRVATVRWRDAKGRVVRGEMTYGSESGEVVQTAPQYRLGFDGVGRTVIVELSTHTRRWTYDEDGRVAGLWERYPDGDAFTDYVRDDAGRLIESASTAVDGSTFDVRWTRDGGGRIVGYTASDAHGLVGDATWQYDGAGRPVTARFLGTSDGAPVTLDASFTWEGDRLVRSHEVQGDRWDYTGDFVRDAHGALLVATYTQASLGVVSRIEIERSARGVTRMRELDGHGAPRWSNMFERTPGHVIRTADVANDPEGHSVEMLDDPCPEGSQPIGDFDEAFAPQWLEAPFLPREPE